MTFKNPSIHSGLGLGAGVTAHNREDAEAMIETEFGPLEVADTKTVSSIDELEQNHVRKNMGNFLKRGIWYPLRSGT